jgi:hypothetical protein
VMHPEFTAHAAFPHSHVECVECHVGPGATGFLHSKIAGIRRVVALSSKTYSRPIPAPVADMNSARETCERCHSRSNPPGQVLSVRPKYKDDEANTASKTVLMLKVGDAIHSAHLAKARQITFLATDHTRQTIPWVQYTSSDGKITEYAATGWDGKKNGELRTMDCMDCHNRPAHTYQLPDNALDEAMAAGRIDPSLPFVKKKGLELLKQGYASQEVALESLNRSLLDYYKTSHPDIWSSKQQAVQTAAAELQQIYSRNVFPDMKIDWGTYPNNIGHTDSPGCFRCHDGDHTDTSKEGGDSITQDCTACHSLLAVEEANPKVLQDLTAFVADPAGDWSKFEAFERAKANSGNTAVAALRTR